MQLSKEAVQVAAGNRMTLCLGRGVWHKRKKSLCSEYVQNIHFNKQIRKDPQNSTQTYDGCPPIQNIELASPDSGEVRADVDEIILHPDYVVRKRNFMFFVRK